MTATAGVLALVWLAFIAAFAWLYTRFRNRA